MSILGSFPSAQDRLTHAKEADAYFQDPAIIQANEDAVKANLENIVKKRILSFVNCSSAQDLTTCQKELKINLINQLDSSFVDTIKSELEKQGYLVIVSGNLMTISFS